MPKTLVLVPAYNEQSTISHVVEELCKLRSDGTIGGFAVIDDHSTDRTARLARQAGAGVVLPSLFEKNGKGEAVLTGLLWAKNQGADLVILLDADLLGDVQIKPAQILAMVHPLRLNPHLDMVVCPQIESTGLSPDWGGPQFEETPMEISGLRALRLAALNFLFCPPAVAGQEFTLARSRPAARFMDMASSYGLEVTLNAVLPSAEHLSQFEVEPLLMCEAHRRPGDAGRQGVEIARSHYLIKQRRAMFGEALKQLALARQVRGKPPLNWDAFVKASLAYKRVA